MRKTILTCVLLTVAGSVAAHQEHHKAEEGHATRDHGEWQEERITIRHDSLWSVEHCSHLEGGHTLQYRFEADIPVNVNVHLHPERDGAYHTIYLHRQDDVRSEADELVTDEPGAYCFEFVPVTRPDEDREIRLQYRVAS